MKLYVIGSPKRVMPASFLSPFPKYQTIVLKYEDILDSLRNAHLHLSQFEGKVAGFIDLQEALEYTKNENYDSNPTVVAQYMEIAPVIAISVPDGIETEMAELSLNGMWEGGRGKGLTDRNTFSVILVRPEDIQEVHSYHYVSGRHDMPDLTQREMEPPREFTMVSPESKCTIS